jgi:exonuclease III
MTTIFNNKTTQCLRIACWNIDGIYQRIAGTRVCKTEDADFQRAINNLDILCLTETHMYVDDNPSIPGFKCFSRHRPKHVKAWRASGGIAVYIKDYIGKGVKLVDDKCSEIMWLKLCKHFFQLDQDIFLAVAYISPLYSSYTGMRDDLFLLLEESIAKYSKHGKCIVLGDFNARTNQDPDYIVSDSTKHIMNNVNIELECDVALCRINSDNHKTDKHGENLLELCRATGMRILNGRCLGDTRGQFTCFSPAGGPSVIDYVLVANDIFHTIRTFQVAPLNPLSIHCMVSFTIQVPYYSRANVCDNVVMSWPIKYKWKQENLEPFQANLCAPDIKNAIANYRDKKYRDDNLGINEAVNDINDIFHTVADKSNVYKVKLNQGPKKAQTARCKHKSWYEADCHTAYKNVKWLAWNLSKNPKDPVLRQTYFKAKKEYKCLLKKKKRVFQATLINTLSNFEHMDPKGFWDTFNKLKDKDKQSDIGHISAVEWMNHFKNLMGSCQTKLNHQTVTDVRAHIKCCKESIFNELDFTINENEVSFAISLLKIKKSTGTDGICNEMLKASASNIPMIKLLCRLFNHIFITGLYPDQWRQNILVPLHKKGAKNNPENYRGIALGSCLSKVFCTILNKRLNKFLHENDILPENQIGFRKGYRTTDHIFVLKTLIDKYTKKLGKSLYACFVDFKAAYDTIWRDGLIYKLIEVGIGKYFLKVIQNMYANVSYCIKSESGGLTPTIPSSRGLKQGGVLSPTLFNIYLYDLPTNLLDALSSPVWLDNKQVNCLMYADDLVLLSESKEGLQHSLNRLETYCTKWGLTVNLSKTKVIVFNKGGKTFKNILLYNNTVVEVVRSYSYLGIIFNTSGSFNDAVQTLKDKGLKALYSVMQHSSLCQPNVALKLFLHMVQPIISYGAEIWAASYFQGLKPSAANFIEICEKPVVEKVLLKFAKMTLGVHSKATNAAVRGELGLFPIILTHLKGIVKYLIRLQKMPQNSLIYKCFNESKHLLTTSSDNKLWMRGINNILSQLNINLLGEDVNIISFENLECYVHNATKDMYVQKWKALMNDGAKNSTGNKLRVYNTFKHEFKLESYLLHLTDKRYRTATTNLRISTHKLRIETGRYNKPSKIPIDERFCLKCKDGSIEDEKHFLLHCSKFDVLRNSLFRNITVIVPSFLSLTDESKFQLLITCMNGDNDICHIVSKYIYDASKLIN